MHIYDALAWLNAAITRKRCLPFKTSRRQRSGRRREDVAGTIGTERVAECIVTEQGGRKDESGRCVLVYCK